MISDCFSFTTKYIRILLHDHGFEQVAILNSPLSEGDPSNLFSSKTLASLVKKFIFLTAKWFEIMSGQQLLLGTSLESTAKKTN